MCVIILFIYLFFLLGGGSQFYQVHNAVNEALESLRQYLQHLHSELTDYCHGAVGSNASMRELIQAASIAWDWAWLCEHRPESKHVHAFLDMWRLLAGCVRHTVWPSPQTHFHVEARWPGEAELAAQYMVLTQRVRDAVAERGADFHEWFPCRSYQVVEFRHSHRLQRVLLKLLHDRLQRSLRGCRGVGREFSAPPRIALPVARILQFLTLGAETGPIPHVFVVPRISLCTLGWGHRFGKLRKNFKERVQFLGGVGDFASLCDSHPKSGCWVLVVEEIRVLNPGAVAASLDLDLRFSAPGAGNRHAWHAVRLHHRMRHVRGVEAACERWGSMLHTLWDDIAGMRAGRLTTRLLLRESGLRCIGSVEDEAFVEELARILVDIQGKSIYRKRGRDQGPSYALRVLAESGGLQSGLFQFADTPGCRLESLGGPQASSRWGLRHEPRALPEKAQEAILAGARKDSTGRLVRNQLPVLAEDARKVRTQRTVSVLRSALKDFLSSDAGRKWALERSALWTNPEDRYDPEEY